MKNSFSSNSFLILIFILIIIWIVASFGKESYRKYQINRDIATLEKELKNLEKTNEILLQLLEYSSSNEALEREARLKLNFLKEGEKLVVISPKKNFQAESKNDAQEVNLKKTSFSNFKIWLKYLFDVNP